MHKPLLTLLPPTLLVVLPFMPSTAFAPLPQFEQTSRSMSIALSTYDLPPVQPVSDFGFLMVDVPPFLGPPSLVYAYVHALRHELALMAEDGDTP